MAFSARHSSRMKNRSRILSYSFDLQSCLHIKYKSLACRVRGNALEKFAVNAWPSWVDARRQYILLVIIVIVITIIINILSK